MIVSQEVTGMKIKDEIIIVLDKLTERELKIIYRFLQGIIKC